MCIRLACNDDDDNDDDDADDDGYARCWTIHFPSFVAGLVFQTISQTRLLERTSLVASMISCWFVSLSSSDKPDIRNLVIMCRLTPFPYLSCRRKLPRSCWLSLARVNVAHLCILFSFFFLHKDGFVFRIKIMHYREMVLLQQSAATKDGKAKDDKAAKELEREIIHLPILTSTLHG